MTVATTFPLAKIEQYLARKHYQPALDYLLRKFGTDVTVYRRTSRDMETLEPAVNDATKEVYGIYDNRSATADLPTGVPLADQDDSATSTQFEVRLLIGHALFTPTDDEFAGDSNDNLIVSPVELRPGDRFEIVRTDGVSKGWKVIEQQDVGATMKVLRRYKVAAIGSIN